MNREQIVRDTAYAIWEAEGKPDGRAEDHWRQAETRVSASLTGGKTKAAAGSAKANGSAKAKATAPAKGQALDVSKEPAAKPPAKAAATKKAPAKAKVEAPKKKV